ncbi:MAG: hypothetical protein LBM23_03720 [Propionibacteriaceae bacterium]|jgi:xylan 1,4-beta-xylosidase|nr:hypothetical protein [Propionibacteriaceae bacterium]
MITVPAHPISRLTSAWRECVGTGRLNLALRADYQASVALTQQEIGFKHIRGHGLLTDDLGVLRRDEGVNRYSFTYIDQVFDFYLDAGLTPFVELGFMPELLASGTDTVFWWKGNITPPREMGEWTALVQALLRHLISRYGRDEVLTWPIEVWNEPNLTVFWKDADQRAYFELYAATARAVKEVDADLVVGGPAISPGAEEWYTAFADYVVSHDLPCDFISGHAYATGDAQHIPFGTYQTLRAPQWLLDQFAAPRQRVAGFGNLDQLPVHITEFNTSYRPDNPVHDTAYNAAYLAPVLAGGGDLVDSFSYWTFCDVFEESGIPTSFFHGGFGLLTHRQIRKPTFHLYAFMARMGEEILARGDDHLVTRHPDGRLAILAWQPLGGTDDGVFGTAPSEHRISLSLPVEAGAGAASTSASAAADGTTAIGADVAGRSAPTEAVAFRQRVNEEDGNAWTAWKRLGRPVAPGFKELDLIDAASQPVVSHETLPIEPGETGQGRCRLDLTLARHEITLVEVLPVAPTRHEGLDDCRILGQDPDGAL